MDAYEISRLFGDQKHMKKYVKKDYIRVYDGRVQANHAKLTCHTLTDKLIDFSKGELILSGYMESTTAVVLAGGMDISIQNGCYSVLSDVKISFNNNEVEHNREPLFSTTYLNWLEFSPDYTQSVAEQYGFSADVNGADGDEAGRRNNLFRGVFANNRFPFTLTIALRDISQFIRRLNFPIINQLFEIEVNVDQTRSIIRADGGPPPSRFVMEDLTLFVPEVVLPTSDSTKLYKEMTSENFVKQLEWDAVEIITSRAGVLPANTPFNELLGTNLVGIKKLIAVVLPNYVAANIQEHNQTVSNVTISDFNIEIDSKDYFNMNVRTDQEAYRLVRDCFNMSGLDVNTGTLLSLSTWKNNFRIYAVDLSRQEAFEGNITPIQQIRIRGTPNAAGTLRVFMFKNKVTEINYSRPSETRTTH